MPITLHPCNNPFLVMHPNPFITHYSYAPSAPCPYCKLVYKRHLLVVPDTIGNDSHFSMMNSGKKAKTRGHSAVFFGSEIEFDILLIFHFSFVTVHIIIII